MTDIHFVVIEMNCLLYTLVMGVCYVNFYISYVIK